MRRWSTIWVCFGSFCSFSGILNIQVIITINCGAVNWLELMIRQLQLSLYVVAAAVVVPNIRWGLLGPWVRGVRLWWLQLWRSEPRGGDRLGGVGSPKYAQGHAGTWTETKYWIQKTIIEDFLIENDLKNELIMLFFAVSEPFFGKLNRIKN